ncbi:MAG: hypothetical protein EPN20_02460 [Magnetospirillum sp.]|nr:MAG: hypothetical protein EPN20_02460 [Magnetospirillum sp.]
MAPLSQGLETGVPAIDAANDGLRFLLERVFEPGVECRRGPSGKGECDHSRCSRIEAILRYIGRNFASQERVMAESSYPEAARHGDDHASLLDRLTVMLQAQVCADRESRKVHDLIAHWMIEHAKRCDTPFGRWAVTRRVLGPRV